MNDLELPTYLVSHEFTLVNKHYFCDLKLHFCCGDGQLLKSNSRNRSKGPYALELFSVVSIEIEFLNRQCFATNYKTISGLRDEEILAKAVLFL